MKKRLFLLSAFIMLVLSVSLSQAPSVQLKIKEKSGFLGMGGPRIVELQLSNQTRQKTLTSENVNAGPFIYFICKPSGEWKINPDFVKDDLSKVTIFQNDQTIPIGFKSDIVTEGDGTSILLGFPKTIKLEQPFKFQIQTGDVRIQIELKVPIELWPGYNTVTELAANAEKAFAAKQFKEAVFIYTTIMSNAALQIFPQHGESKDKRTICFESYLNETTSSFQSLKDNSQIELKEKIAKIEGFKPLFLYVIDSLPNATLGITATDASVAPLVDRGKNLILQIGLVRDSLQRVLDERNVRWISEGSATGKNGIYYQYMIETLAYAFSSLNFADTAAPELKARIPQDISARLNKNKLTESYETFLRQCNERYQSRLPIFPPELLTNLHKDTAVFALPFYSMIKAVQDFYAANFSACTEEIFKIFRTCYESELTARFDNMRVMIDKRLNRVPLEVLKLIEEGEELEAKKDMPAAGDKFRQATIIAPTFAYASYALGKFYVRTGDPVRAITFFQKAYQLDSLYLSAYRESYNLYRKQGNYKPMIEVLTLALARGNDYWETNSTLGQAFMGDGDPARAIERYKRALELSPRSYQTSIQLGQAFQTVKDYQKAREYFNKAIEIDALRQEAVDALNRLNELQRTAR